MAMLPPPTLKDIMPAVESTVACFTEHEKAWLRWMRWRYARGLLREER